MLKAYKYRIYPTKKQEESFFQHFGACRFVYNWALENKIKSYEQNGKSVSRFTLNKMITELKEEHTWLKNVNSGYVEILSFRGTNQIDIFTKYVCIYRSITDIFRRKMLVLIGFLHSSTEISEDFHSLNVFFR